MVADFVSADYGWLVSKDGEESARVLFRAGKDRDGYFKNNGVISQVRQAMSILRKDYPDDIHIFIYDNAPTHLKRPDDALSARHLPMSSRKWFVKVKVPDANGAPLVSKVVLNAWQNVNGNDPTASAPGPAYVAPYCPPPGAGAGPVMTAVDGGVQLTGGGITLTLVQVND